MNPRSSTLVMTSYPRVWQQLADVTCPTHKAWADAIGADYYADCSDLVDSYYNPQTGLHERLPIKGFIKLDLFLYYLPQYKRVVWLDADMAVTNTAVPLESLMAYPPESGGRSYPITVPYDFNGHNATVIIVRNDTGGDLVEDFFWAANNTGRKLFLKHDWVEMEAMRYFAMTQPYTAILGYRSIKTLCPLHPGAYVPYVPERVTKKYEWTPGDWSVHLSALPLDVRIQLAKEYAAK